METEYTEKDVVFPKKRIENIVKLCVSQVLKADTAYDYPLSGQWMSDIIELVVKSLCGLNSPYKFICTCLIMQNNGAGFHCANAAYYETWDGIYSYKAEFKSLYCLCTVYGLAL